MKSYLRLFRIWRTGKKRAQVLYIFDFAWLGSAAATKLEKQQQQQQ